MGVKEMFRFILFLLVCICSALPSGNIDLLPWQQTMLTTLKDAKQAQAFAQAEVEKAGEIIKQANEKLKEMEKLLDLEKGKNNECKEFAFGQNQLLVDLLSFKKKFLQNMEPNEKEELDQILEKYHFGK